MVYATDITAKFWGDYDGVLDGNLPFRDIEHIEMAVVRNSEFEALISLEISLVMPGDGVENVGVGSLNLQKDDAKALIKILQMMVDLLPS